MRKILFTLLILACASTSLFAQAPVLKTLEGEDITNRYVERRAENIDEMYFMQYHFLVCNESSTDMVVDLYKTDIQVVEGTMSTFCYNGNCVSPDVTEYLGVTIAAGATSNVDLDYMTNNGPEDDGVTTVMYEFTANGETSYVVVNFIIGDYNGLEEAPPVLKNMEGEDITNLTIDCHATNEEEMYFLQYHFQICNASETTNMVVELQKTVIQAVEGTSNTFCYDGNCVSPDVMEYPSVVIAPNGSSTIDLDYSANGIMGTTTVQYTFTTSNGKTSQITVNFIGDYEDGIEDAPVVDANLYPNPVSSVSTFECNVPQDAVLQVYSCTGQKLNEYALYQGENKVTINASEYASGLYICSVVMKGAVVQTKKMIVK